MDERHKWFLKNLYHAKKNDWLVITHEHLGRHYKEYVENCGERFFQEFEMQRLDDDEYEKISKGFVPDEIFEEKERELGSRTEFLSYMFQERYCKLEQCLIRIIDEEIKKRVNERVEGIFNCLECFASIRYLGTYYNCPVIPYVFSAIRKVHGYQQTMYTVSMDGNLCSCNDSMGRYIKFIKEEQEHLLFSRKELLTLFGKRENIFLLNAMDYKPCYEVGICTDAWNVNSRNFLKLKYTDDDIYYKCKKLYPKEMIQIRVHPITYDRMGVGREHLKNDPVSFILSCKRIVSVQSQILLKAMLWNRTVCMEGDFAQFSFLCEKDLASEGKVDITKLNYFILGFMIPAEYMFHVGYWRWRINDNPSEHDIYNRHMEHYFERFGLDRDILSRKSEKERFQYLLQKRECSKDLIDDLLNGNVSYNINYDVLSSKLVAGKNSVVLYSFNCINNFKNGKVYSKFALDCKEPIDFIRFYPFVDVGGNAKINGIWINGICEAKEKEFIYYSKKKGYEEVSNRTMYPKKYLVEVEWEYTFG